MLYPCNIVISVTLLDMDEQVGVDTKNISIINSGVKRLDEQLLVNGGGESREVIDLILSYILDSV